MGKKKMNKRKMPLTVEEVGKPENWPTLPYFQATLGELNSVWIKCRWKFWSTTCFESIFWLSTATHDSSEPCASIPSLSWIKSLWDMQDRYVGRRQFSAPNSFTINCTSKRAETKNRPKYYKSSNKWKKM